MRTRKLNSRKLRKSRKKLSKKIAKKGGTSCRGHSEDEFLKRFVDAQNDGTYGSTRKKAIQEINKAKKNKSLDLVYFS